MEKRNVFNILTTGQDKPISHYVLTKNNYLTFDMIKDLLGNDFKSFYSAQFVNYNRNVEIVNNVKQYKRIYFTHNVKNDGLGENFIVFVSGDVSIYIEEVFKKYKKINDLFVSQEDYTLID